MSLELIITLIVFSVILLITTTIILKKGLVSVKYSLLWYFIAIIIFLVAVLSGPLESFAHLVGFQTLANLVIGIVLALLVFLSMSLTIIVSTQRKKTTLLIQELSLLKSKQKSQKSPTSNQTTKPTKTR